MTEIHSQPGKEPKNSRLVREDPRRPSNKKGHLMAATAIFVQTTNRVPVNAPESCELRHAAIVELAANTRMRVAENQAYIPHRNGNTGETTRSDTSAGQPLS